MLPYKFSLIGLFLIGTLPLLNIPPWFFPLDWGKTAVFRIIMSGLLLLFIAHILTPQGRNFFIARITQLRTQAKLPIVLFLGLFFSFLLSTLLSVDPSFSFWGDPSRSGGFLNLIFYFLLALLAFFTIQPADWRRVWDAILIAGIGVAVIAVFQQFGDGGRPVSTLGATLFLGAYMLFLSFFALSSAFDEKNQKKRYFYLLSSLLFVLVVLLTGSRSAYLGLIVGSLYFLFFMPTRSMIRARLFLGASLLALILSSSFFIVSGRFSLDVLSREPRPSAWRVSLNAVAERPLFGYGPENFSIGFDRFFDPALPNFQTLLPTSPTTWWDRAHNVFLDIAVSSGVGALALYLALLGVLFFKLRKLKTRAAHGIQTALLAYLVANLFSFDTFPTYLLFFLGIGYSLFLVTADKPVQPSIPSIWHKAYRYRFILLSLCFLGAVWFAWQYNIQPLITNANINNAEFLAANGQCTKAFQIMENITSQAQTPPLASYARLSYVDILRACDNFVPEARVPLAEKGYALLAEEVQLRPLFTRNWIFLGGFTNIIMEAAPERVEELKAEAQEYFQMAHELSPRRQEVYVEWIQTFILSGDYQGAKAKAQECIALNPQHGGCQWLNQITQLYTGELERIELQRDKTDPFEPFVNSESALNQLVKAYIATENYRELIPAYTKLSRGDPTNYMYHASLAVTYAKLEYTGLAKQEITKTVELYPDSAPEAEIFLATLPSDHVQLLSKYTQLLQSDPRNPYYRLALADAYLQLGEVERALNEAIRVEDLPLIKEGFLMLLVPVYEELIRNEPSNSEYRSGLTELYHQLNYSEETIQNRFQLLP